jgi:hypothetical protein
LVDELDRVFQIPDDSLRAALIHFIESRRTLMRRYRAWIPADMQESPLCGFMGYMRASLAGETSPDVYQDAVRVIYLYWRVYPLFFPPYPTAIIAANDRIARSWVQPALVETRRHVPADVSLIGFDNTFKTTFAPPSTIDFGFGHLGYQAIHAILGDVPVMADRHGDIAARASYVDRGTVGPARGMSRNE